MEYMRLLSHRDPLRSHIHFPFQPVLFSISFSDWITNQHRDTLASHVGHYDQLSYYSVAQNESIARVRLQMLEKIYQPCGP